jgi:oligosaccharyltransferase complex subunit alpha (ribophorin I)
MPTQYHLFQDVKNTLEHTLEVDFMHGYDKSLTEDYTVKVILPEGASNIRVIMPTGCGITNENLSMGKFFGTLDWFGRPELKIVKKNVVHDLCDDTLRVKYTFDNSKDLALEPICMFIMLMSCFIVTMFLTRVGFDTGAKKISDEDKIKKN